MEWENLMSLSDLGKLELIIDKALGLIQTGIERTEKKGETGQGMFYRESTGT